MTGSVLDIAVGDLFSGRTPNGAYQLCRADEVAGEHITALRIFAGTTLVFRRADGVEVVGDDIAAIGVIDSVAPLPAEWAETILAMHERQLAKAGISYPSPDRFMPTEQEWFALWDAHRHHREHPIHPTPPETARTLMARARDTAEPTTERAEAAYTLGRYPYEEVQALLVDLAAEPATPHTLRSAALEALIGHLNHLPAFDPDHDLEFLTRLDPHVADHFRSRLPEPRFRNILVPTRRVHGPAFAVGYPPCQSPTHDEPAESDRS